MCLLPADRTFIPFSREKGPLFLYYWTVILAAPMNFDSTLSVMWNDLADPGFDGVIRAGFKSREYVFSLA